MNSMGEVFKKSDAAERAEEVRLLKQQLEKDKAATAAENDKANQKRLKNMKIKETLD